LAHLLSALGVQNHFLIIALHVVAFNELSFFYPCVPMQILLSTHDMLVLGVAQEMQSRTDRGTALEELQTKQGGGMTCK
jgi:hypothetical protein